jgi:deoxyadenosine/deoxycytidine kinase
MKKTIFAVDGLIGAGKSTLLTKYSKQYPTIMVILEPIDKWMQSELLQNFYKEPKKWAFKLQMFIMDSFKDQLNEAFSKNIKCILMERSHLAAFTIFSYLHWKNGLLTNQEYRQLELQHQVYDRELRQNGYVFNHIYLDVSLDVAMERMASRNRGNETSGVTREYQQSFIDRYKELCLTPYTEEQLDQLVEKYSKY